MKRRGMRRILSALVLAVMLITAVSVPALAGQMEITISASVDGQSDETQMINQYLNGSCVDLIAGSTQDGGLLNLSVNVAGTELFKALLEVTPQVLAFSLPAIDENRYEYPVQKLIELARENFDGQVTFPDGSQFQLDQMPVSAPDIEPEEVQEALMPYIQYLVQSVGEKLQVSENTEIELTDLEETVDGTLIVYEPTPEELAKLFTDLADMIEQDEKLEALVVKLSDYINNLKGITAVASTVTETPDAQEMSQALQENFANLPGQLREAAQGISESGFGGEGGYLRVSAGMPESGDLCLVKLEAADGSTGETIEFNYEYLMKDGHKKRSFLVHDGISHATGVISDETTQGTHLIGTAAIKADGDDLADIAYDWDLSRRSELWVPYGICAADIQGVLNVSLLVAEGEQGGTDHIFHVSGVQYLNGSDEITDASLTFHSSDETAPEAPAGSVVDLGSLTQEELQQVIGELANKLMASLGVSE